MLVQFLNAATKVAVQPEVEGNSIIVTEAFSLFMIKCSKADPAITIRDSSPEPGLIVRTLSDGHEVRLYTDYYDHTSRKEKK